MATGPSKGSRDDMLRFVANAAAVGQRCGLNYEYAVSVDELPPQYAAILASPAINADANGEETAKFVSPEDRQLRKNAMDRVKVGHVSPLLAQMADNYGIIFQVKNAAWKTRDSFYSMYRCGCRGQRLLDDNGQLAHQQSQFEVGQNALKFPQVTSCTEVINMWINEISGQTNDFVSANKKRVHVTDDQMNSFIDAFKHLEEENDFSSIEYVKQDEKFNTAGTCPCYLSVTCKLSTLELKVKMRYFPHDPSVNLLKRSRGNTGQRKKTKLNVDEEGGDDEKEKEKTKEKENSGEETVIKEYPSQSETPTVEPEVQKTVGIIENNDASAIGEEKQVLWI